VSTPQDQIPAFDDFVKTQPQASPANVWTLDRAEDVKKYFRDSFGRDLPVSAFGESGTHRRMNLDHSEAMDVALHPNSKEGSALISYLRERGIPFLAYDRAVKGAATAPHIHIGLPSKRGVGVSSPTDVPTFDDFVASQPTVPTRDRGPASFTTEAIPFKNSLSDETSQASTVSARASLTPAPDIPPALGAYRTGLTGEQRAMEAVSQKTGQMGSRGGVVRVAVTPQMGAADISYAAHRDLAARNGLDPADADAYAREVVGRQAESGFFQHGDEFVNKAREGGMADVEIADPAAITMLNKRLAAKHGDKVLGASVGQGPEIPALVKGVESAFDSDKAKSFGYNGPPSGVTGVTRGALSTAGLAAKAGEKAYSLLDLMTLGQWNFAGHAEDARQNAEYWTNAVADLDAAHPTGLMDKLVGEAVTLPIPVAKAKLAGALLEEAAAKIGAKVTPTAVGAMLGIFDTDPKASPEEAVRHVVESGLLFKSFELTQGLGRAGHVAAQGALGGAQGYLNEGTAEGAIKGAATQAGFALTVPERQSEPESGDAFRNPLSITGTDKHHSNFQPRDVNGTFVEGKPELPEPASADRLRLKERAQRAESAVPTRENVPGVTEAQSAPIVGSSVPTREQVLASLQNEKPSKKTGLTKSQSEYVAGEARAARGTLPEDGRVEGEEVTIKVPGDGEYELFTQKGADRLHRKLTGKTVEEFQTAKDSTVPTKPAKLQVGDEVLTSSDKRVGTVESRKGDVISVRLEDGTSEIFKEKALVSRTAMRSQFAEQAKGATAEQLNNVLSKPPVEDGLADVRREVAQAELSSRQASLVPTKEQAIAKAEPQESPAPESSVPTKAQALSNQAGAVDADLLTLGVRKFVGQDVVPAAKKVIEGVSETADAVRSLVAPPSRGAEAKATSRIVRANASDMARTYDIAEQSLKGAKDFFSKQTPEDNYAFIDRVEKGIAQPDPNQQAFADTFRTMLDERRQAVQDLGTGKLEDFIDNYFPHIWDDPVKAKAVFGKRPLEGSKSFLKQRSLPTTADGLAAGLKPVSDNPVDLALLKVREMDRYVMAHQVMGEMKEQGILKYVRASEKLPEGYTFIDDRVATVYGGPDAKPEGGMLIRGRYAAPEPAANVLNNYLSPGIKGTKYAKPYEAWRAVSNTMNQAQLGFSFFHAGMTSIDAAVSRFAVGLEDLLVHGKPLRAAKTIASTPASPITNLIQGSKVLKEWYKPGSVGGEIADIVNAMVEGGGRARMDEFYRVRATEKMTQALKDGNIIGAALRLPSAVIEKATHPIMEWLVPRQKAGVFAEMAKRELERLGPGADRMAVRDAMARAWDSVDNRMGQLVYDNLFWNKTGKDLAMASVRSVGWNVGTFREVGGGLTDVLTVPKRIKAGEPLFTHRMAYVASLPVVVGTLGAVTQYMLTGEGPKELKDYFFPRTGNTDERGNPERITFPSYMKDIFHLKREHPAQTVTSKLHPLITTVAEMLQNEDYYGTQIRNPDDPLTQQALDELRHLGTAFVPFSARGFAKERERGTSTVKSLLPFVGITPAPAYVNKSEGVRMMDEMLGEKMPGGARTQEEASHSLAKYGFIRRIRKGETFASLQPEIQTAIKDGTLTLRDMPDILKGSFSTQLESRFKKLTLEQSLKVFEALAPEEKEQTIDELKRKRYLLLNIPESRRKLVEAKFDKLIH
jgi:hypothetical protein